MSDTAPQLDELQAFEQADLDLRLQRGKIGLILGLFMMPAGIVLDLLFYPQFLWQLLTVRALTTAVLAAGLVVMLWVPLGRKIRWASLGLVLFPALAIALMIYLTDAENSTYFVGLTLLMLLIQLLGFSAAEAAVYCGLVVVAYLAAIYGNHGFSVSGNHVALGTFFLLATSAVSVVVCHLNLRNRRTEFLLRRTLDEKNHQLEELDRLRAGFLANVSHELRTPLSLIIAPIEEILSTRQTVTPQMGQTLTLVRKNADRLRLLVDDLLDVVRLDHGVMRLDVEEVDAREFLLQIIRTLQPMAEDRQIKLVAELQTAPLDLRLDVARVERVLMNLITNSLKFSPEKSTVRVQLEARERAAAIIVSDEGPGIPEADRVQIFDRFFQASNNRARASQGLGLGLAIAREIVRSHGGEIEAHNNPVKGCRFVVTLPLEWDPADHPPASQTEDTAATERRTNRLTSRAVPSVEEVTADARAIAAARVIKEGPQELLVIDDEPDLRHYLVDSLQSEFATAGAATCAQGLALAKELKPACILLDLMLPDGSGLDVLKAVRADATLRDTKVVMLTANLDETIKIDALRLGADDFLSKPFGITEVRTRVAGLVRSSHLQGLLRREREELQQSLVRLRETEVKLFQSEKMRGLGSLAAGLLHEINNPVHYTLLAIRSLKKDLAAGRDTSEVVGDIESGVTRVGQILDELRNFAYPEQAQLHTEFRLVDVVRTSLRFTSHATRTIALDVADADFEGLFVRGSQIQIGQVLVNLITNSATAIQKQGDKFSGQITIRARRVRDRVQVMVADNGPGIPAADLSRVLEPFYSTAAPGSGLGLGLSICDTIIRNHGGSLVLTSNSLGNTELNNSGPRGTEVSFDLPLVLSEGNLYESSSHREADSVRR
ncbi:Sensor histidine kinase TmoS [Anatilimnocola aggregata]|uniref:histidine kinase n=1 Tax=Anatilimnocola aggregata TaxID=2528021 RepID=A0A517Y9Q0_9BACT|nr:ATP-binding protein [Anatilimnocola aggregata]QDU26948.1 Sensor histidine kinase TmoS [Anatilimnocola aggregata]